MDVKSEIEIKEEELDFDYDFSNHHSQIFPNSGTNFTTTNSIKIEEPDETLLVMSDLGEIKEDSMLDEEQIYNDVKNPEMSEMIFTDVDAQGEDSKVESSESRPLTSGTVDQATKENCQKYYRCRFCNLTFKNLDELANHLKTHEKKRFKCAHCSYECNFKAGLKYHLLIHCKIFKCSECSYECNQKSSLKLHLLTHRKLLKCSECDYESKNKNNLKAHVLTHSILKLFKCPECSFESKYKANLKTHIFNKHRTDQMIKSKNSIKNLFLNGKLKGRKL